MDLEQYDKWAEGGHCFAVATGHRNEALMTANILETAT
jgi:hypothetical protein